MEGEEAEGGVHGSDWGGRDIQEGLNDSFGWLVLVEGLVGRKSTERSKHRMSVHLKRWETPPGDLHCVTAASEQRKRNLQNLPTVRLLGEGKNFNKALGVMITHIPERRCSIPYSLF